MYGYSILADLIKPINIYLFIYILQTQMYTPIEI